MADFYFNDFAFGRGNFYMDTLEKCLKYISKNKCNLEINFYVDDAGVDHYYCRVRPWGKKAPKNIMFVGDGPHPDSAVASAAHALETNDAKELDWSYRPGKFYGYGGIDQSTAPTA